MKPEQIKPALRDCISFQLASKQQTDIEQNESLSTALNRAIEYIPQVKFIDQAHYLKNVLLPEIEKKRGKESGNYKYYFSVFESLMYAIKIADKEQTFRRLISQEKLYNEFLKKRVLFLENELMRYTTLDSLSTKELTEELFNRQNATT